MQMSRSHTKIRAIETNATVDKKKIYTDSLILLALSEKITGIKERWHDEAYKKTIMFDPS